MGHAKLSTVDRSESWPSFLKKLPNDAENFESADAPILVRMGDKDSEAALKSLVSKNDVLRVLDNYDEQYAELQLSLNAQLYRANVDIQRNSIKDLLDEHYKGRPAWQLGTWVYYPWSKQLVHVLDELLFNQLRTIRNRDLITKEEQAVLEKFNVACLGMSVGSASALALTISGISQRIKLADGAVISGSNLNRILTGVESVGLEKSLVIGRKLYEMNPYVTVHRHGKLTADSVESLFDEPWPIEMVVDEIDDLESKIRIRLEARKRKVPVVMATELADSVMLDVERYDLDPNLPLFHGLVPGIDTILEKDLNHREWMKHAVSIIGAKNMPISMQKSLMKIGSTIVTHPQLGSTVMMTGGVIAFAAKQIALGEELPSGRSHISLEHILVPKNRTRKHKKDHKKHTKIIQKAIDSM